MTEKHLKIRMKDGNFFEIHPCIDASLNFTSERWRQEIKKAMKNLSPQSLWQRFATGVNELSEEQLDYLTDIDGKNRVAWCAVIFNDDDMTGVGLSRYIRLHEEQHTAEFAITVIDKYQHQGVGRALLAQLVNSARDNGLRYLRGYVLAGNTAMLALSADFNAVQYPEDNYVRVEIPLDNQAG